VYGLDFGIGLGWLWDTEIGICRLGMEFIFELEWDTGLPKRDGIWIAGHGRIGVMDCIGMVNRMTIINTLNCMASY
jgi:hypothetical protein